MNLRRQLVPLGTFFVALLVVVFVMNCHHAFCQAPIETYPKTSWVEVTIPESQIVVGTLSFDMNFQLPFPTIGSSLTNWLSAFQFGNFYTSSGSHAANATSTATSLKGLTASSISFSGDALENNSIPARYSVETLGGGVVKSWRQNTTTTTGSDRGLGGFFDVNAIDAGALVSFAAFTATVSSPLAPDLTTIVTNVFPFDASLGPHVSFIGGSEQVVVSDAGYFLTNEIIPLGSIFAAPGESNSPFTSLPLLEGAIVDPDQILSVLVVPEPTTLAMLGLALSLMGAQRRFRFNARRSASTPAAPSTKRERRGSQ